MKFFLYYFNYSVLKIYSNSRIQSWKFKHVRFCPLFYIDQLNESTTTNQKSLIVMIGFINHFFKRIKDT